MACAFLPVQPELQDPERLRHIGASGVDCIHDAAAAIVAVAVQRFRELAVQGPDADSPRELRVLRHPQSAVGGNRKARGIGHALLVVGAELRAAGLADGPQRLAVGGEHLHLVRAPVAHVDVAGRVDRQVCRFFKPLRDHDSRLALRREGKANDFGSADRQQVAPVRRYRQPARCFDRNFGNLGPGAIVGHDRIAVAQSEARHVFVLDHQQLVLVPDRRNNHPITSRQTADAVALFGLIDLAPGAHRHMDIVRTPPL